MRLSSIVRIGNHIGTVGVICHIFSIYLCFHGTICNLFTICGILRQILPGVLLCPVVRRCRYQCDFLPFYILPFTVSTLFLLELEGRSKSLVGFFRIVCILPDFLYGIGLQFNVGKGILCSIRRNRIPISGNFRFITLEWMLHYLINKRLSIPVIFGKVCPLHSLETRFCRGNLFQNRLCITMPAAFLCCLILKFQCRLNGRSRHSPPLLGDADRFLRIIQNQLVGDSTLVAAEFTIIDVIKGFKSIICRIQIVLCAQNFTSLNRIPVLIHSIIRMFLYGTEIQGIVGSAVLSYDCNRKILQSFLPVISLRDGEGISSIHLNILPIGKVKITFGTTGFP